MGKRRRGWVVGAGTGEKVFSLARAKSGLVAASLVVVFACGSSSLAQTRREQRQMARQGHHAGEWLRKYKDLPPDQQQKALENDPQFKSLPADRQQKLRDRLQRFNNLPPKQQQRILDRMETWEHLTPEQKQQARDVF